MAEKKQGASYESIMKELRARNFSPIYLLMGDESYYIDKICDYLMENVLQPEERDFNQVVLFGSPTVTAVEVVDQCKGYPMMAKHRVVVLKEAQNLKNFDALDKYFEKPVKSTILCVCYKNGILKTPKTLLTKVSQVGVLLESKKLKDYQLVGFIEKYLKQHNTNIEPKAAQMIADHIGPDLHRLTSELDKVLISLPEADRRVTPEIVEREVGVSKDFNVFELRNAIVNKDVFKANQIIQYFDNNPKTGGAFSLLPLLFAYFQNLMLAFYAPNKQNESELAKFLDLKSTWGVRDYTTGMRNYHGVKVMQIISKMKEVDAKMKGFKNPNTSPGELMKELLFFILH